MKQQLHYHISLARLTLFATFGGLLLILMFARSGAAQTQTFNPTYEMSSEGNIQNFTVPTGVTSLTITAKGSVGGGTSGGKGTTMKATFAVTPGALLKIVVGAKGHSSTNDAKYGGGGGGSFVAVGDINEANLLIAAGGGGGGGLTPGGDASTTAGDGSGGGPGFGTLGGGGGGAGINGNGEDAGLEPCTGGAGCGGFKASAGGSSGNGGAVGGFGGGGGAGFGGGGGGGYTGGKGGNQSLTVNFEGEGGGGGSSYTKSGATAVSASVNNTGVGQVIIEWTATINPATPNDFITTWANTTGSFTQLQFNALTTGPVAYSYITNLGQSGSGIFTATTLGIVTLTLGTTIAAGEVLTLVIEPTNLRQVQLGADGNFRNFLTDIPQWGSTAWTSMNQAFQGCENLNISATDVPNLSGVTDMSNMFNRCSKLNGPANIGTWNVSTVINMAQLFELCLLFNQDIGTWNTAAVSNMNGMFGGARDFNQPIGNWNTGAVSNMSGMFNAAIVFNQAIGNWNTAAVINMNSMFNSANAFNQPIGTWNTAAVTDMGFMFRNAAAFNQNIGTWNVSKVTTFAEMFTGANAFNQNISNWNISSAISLLKMFRNATAFNQPIGTWNVSNVTDMRGMFDGATAFNQNLGAWTFNAAVTFNEIGGNSSRFLRNTGMSCANYSATLIGWAANPNTPNNRFLNDVNLTYGTNATAARNLLTNTVANGGKNWFISGDVASGSACTLPPPALSPIANQSTCDGESITDIAISLSGDIDGLTLAATSSNAGITGLGFTFGGSGANRTLSITTTAGQVGATTISVIATNSSGGSATQTFVLEVGNKGSNMVWTAQTAPASDYFSIAYGNGIYVALGQYGSTRVMTSPDGITWTAGTAVGNVDWSGITYGNGRFVAVGQSPPFGMTSTDGINWVSTPVGNGGWQDITYGNGLFVAVAEINNKISTSPDGLNWTIRTEPSPNEWRGITYANGQFVAVGRASGNQVMTSPDGINWTARTSAPSAVLTHWQDIAYGNGVYVAVGYLGTTQVMSSPDGITWTARTPTQSSQWESVTFADGIFVAVSSGGLVMTSPDGITWTARTPAAGQWTAVTYANGQFVAVSFGGTNRVMTSPGITTTYTPCNAKPVFSPATLANETLCQSAGNVTLTNRTLTVSDPDMNGSIVSTTVSSSNPNLVTVSNTGTNTAVNLALIQQGGQSGSAIISVESTDNLGAKSTLSFTLTVNPAPNAMATPATQTICSAATITSIALSSNITGTTYTWTRDNTATVTGIAANGSGTISGSLTNATNAPVMVTFTITPTANNCPGTPITATVIVNPTPNAVATPASQTSCSGAAISAITLSGNVTGTTYTWTRDNTANVTDIAANGSGTISGSLTNTTNALVTVTFTITPTANNCPGTPITATVTVGDTEPPTITCPSNITVNSTAGLCGAVVTYTAPVGTDNCSGATTTQMAGLASGTTFPVGTTTNTFKVTAANGQTATCSFTVTVVDVEPPTITCPSNITVNSTAGLCGAVVTYTAPVGTDNCSGATTTQIAGLASGATFPVGTTTNTFKVTAANGQTTTCSFTVTVVDVEPPTISCPANISVNNTAGLCGAVMNFTTPVGTDNCSGATTTQIAGLASGATFPVGTTTNTFKVTAANGQTATCSFTVTVTDIEPPTITCPADITVCEGTMITYTPPVGLDNCMGAVTTQTAGLPSGMMYPVGITTNSFTVKANNNQTATCSFTVTVRTKPTITLTTLQQTFNEGNSQTLCDTDTDLTNTLLLNVTTACVAATPVWRTQVGSGAWSDWSATVPTNQPSNNTAYRYQAACDANCPITYTQPISLTINYRASVPQNVSLVADGTTVNAGESKTICNTEGNTITFNATCGTGEILLYSVDGSDYTSVAPSQSTDGNFHNYRLRCRKADGTPSCVETESDVMSLKITTPAAAPVVSITPTSNCGTPTAFTGSSSCGTLVTVWYNATTNLALPTLPTTTPNQTTSYYARCQAEGGCLSEKSNTVTFNITPVNDAPVITVSADLVCAGTEVTVSTNCPAGTTILWNTGVTETSFKVAFNNVTKATYWAKCISANGCQSPVSTAKNVSWKAFELTFINVGQSKSATKSNDKAAWASQFITPDAGPSLDYSTEANPTIYFSENVNKTAPRFWTIQAETCHLGTNGSVTYDMLATPELGVPRSFNTHENNAPYFMYANREGFTELYAQNHPAYGFYQDNGSGGNVYDTGLPKGLYKLGIRYWDQKGQGSIYPSTRQPAGNVLAYQEYWFRIQSKNGVGTGSARVAATTDNEQRRTDNGAFAQVMPNPVSNTLHLKVTDAKDQKVNVSLVDASGRTMLQRAFVPHSNQHQEEFEVSNLANGMYFLKINSDNEQVTLKVVKAG